MRVEILFFEGCPNHPPAVELVRETARIPELEYIFKHELARDAAYGTILRRRRRELPGRYGS